MKRFLVLSCMLLLMVSLAPVLAQGDTESLTVEFSVYDGNPVLPLGEEGEWDDAVVYAGKVVYVDGLFHMMYSGGQTPIRTAAIGYATSEDGINWTKYEGNPVLIPEFGLAGSRNSSVFSALLVEDDTWVLYIQPDMEDVYRATAPDPTGPWTIGEEPVMEPLRRRWDVEFRINSAVHTDDGYALYYAQRLGTGIGIATSPDGFVWTRYDDPETTGGVFLESDPIIMTIGGSDSWDAGSLVDPVVSQGEHGWKMFYAGGQMFEDGGTIGLATSTDGVSWTRYEDNPVLPLEVGRWRQASSMVVVDDTYYLYYGIPRTEITYNILRGWTGHGIGLATGTITRE